MGIKLAVDYWDEGYEMFKKGQPRPRWDGTGPTSYQIDGWERAAKEARHPGYECDCVSFDCPFHKDAHS